MDELMDEVSKSMEKEKKKSGKQPKKVEEIEIKFDEEDLEVM